MKWRKEKEEEDETGKGLGKKVVQEREGAIKSSQKMSGWCQWRERSSNAH